MSLPAQVPARALSTQTPLLAAAPAGPSGLHLEAQPARPAPRRRAPRGSARSRGVPAPHGAPKGSLDAPGRVRGAARLCPQRAALAAHCPGGRLRARLSARPAPRPPAVLPQRLSPPASSRGRVRSRGRARRPGRGWQSLSGPAGRGRRGPSRRLHQQPHLGAPGGTGTAEPHRRPGAPGHVSLVPARSQAPAPRTLPQWGRREPWHRASEHTLARECRLSEKRKDGCSPLAWSTSGCRKDTAGQDAEKTPQLRNSATGRSKATEGAPQEVSGLREGMPLHGQEGPRKKDGSAKLQRP